ncbi:MAG: hypothetical protein EBX41_02020 [Chitinophagia bacterium]|nr:hypothetical protein [Chitinophagia bacterium]
MLIINYEGANIAFKDVFYQYCKLKEGYRNSVYKDHKGFDTIGIGHLVTGSEPFHVVAGKTYTDSQIKQLFDLDYDRLGIEAFAEEIKAAGYTGYNMMLAVSHFVWAHGGGQYRTSTLRKGLLANQYDLSTVKAYLKANWDLRSAPNQRVNAEDFEVGFSPTPWQPGFTLPSRSN